MFTKVSNASKFGFISLVRRLEKLGFELIDCQQQTRHLESLGGRCISRKNFLAYLGKNKEAPNRIGHWGWMESEM